LIDFRYHLVSIIAVFLALALGLAVGAAELAPKVANTLNTESKNALKRNAQLFAENSQLKKQISADGAFAQASSGYLLNNLLTGQRVVLVTAPGADTGTVTGITTALGRAGASVTGTVSLAPQFFDTNPTTETALTEAAGRLAPAWVATSDAAGAQIPGQQAAAKVIAAAIIDKPGQPMLTAQQSNRILTGFGDEGFLQVSTPGGGTTLASQATLAVVVTPAAVSSNASSISPENLSLVYLTHYLQQAGNGAVLAGSLQGSGAGSAIDAVTSGGAGVTVMTVDDADTEIGQIIVAQALYDLLTGRPASSYGVGPGAAPSPAPTPSQTPTSTPSKPTRKKSR